MIQKFEPNWYPQVCINNCYRNLGQIDTELINNYRTMLEKILVELLIYIRKEYGKNLLISNKEFI